MSAFVLVLQVVMTEFPEPFLIDVWLLTLQMCTVLHDDSMYKHFPASDWLCLDVHDDSSCKRFQTTACRLGAARCLNMLLAPHTWRFGSTAKVLAKRVLQTFSLCQDAFSSTARLSASDSCS